MIPKGWTEVQYRNAQRSWALAEMYPVNIFPSPEKQAEIAMGHELALAAQLSLQAAGLDARSAHRLLIGLRP